MPRIYKIVVACSFLYVVFVLCACGVVSNNYIHTNTEPTEIKLSDLCDYTLCEGNDSAGNTYELVASQEETALGYEITVGIIKNNTWLVPMSSDSPFLRNDGLFFMEGGLDLGYVSRAKFVASHFYFIEPCAFMLKYADLHRGFIRVIYNCNTMQSYTYEERDDYKWLYQYYELKTMGSVEKYDVISYGKVVTEDNQILMYQDVSDPYDWSSQKKYNWLILDTETMQIRTIASNVVGNYPKCALSEGLFFADDECFYDVCAEKVVDLSRYDIDIWENGGLYFENGTCMFIAENDLGTEFEIVIDTAGRVLSEIKK